MSATRTAFPSVEADRPRWIGYVKEFLWTALEFAVAFWVSLTVINGHLEMVRSRPIPRPTQRAQRELPKPRGAQYD